MTSTRRWPASGSAAAVGEEREAPPGRRRFGGGGGGGREDVGEKHLVRRRGRGRVEADAWRQRRVPESNRP